MNVLEFQSEEHTVLSAQATNLYLKRSVQLTYGSERLNSKRTCINILPLSPMTPQSVT